MAHDDKRVDLLQRIKVKFGLTDEEVHQQFKHTPTDTLPIVLVSNSLKNLTEGRAKEETMDEVTMDAEMNVAPSPEVDGPSEGSPEEKAPSSELADTSNIEEAKDPEGVVEKSIDELAQEGSKPNEKSAQAAPERIKVNGNVYKKVPNRIKFRGAEYELDD